MKSAKTLVLAGIAAMALMAVVGAGTASATTLKANGVIQPAGIEIVASITGSALLTSTAGETLDTCTAGTVSGKTNQETAAEITGAAAVTWGKAGTECTKTTETIKGGTLGISWIEGTKNGKVKSFNAEVTVFTLGLSCIYGTAATGTTLGELKGSETGNATIEINATVEKKGGPFLCPGSAIWKAAYAVTGPTKLWVIS